MKNTYINDNQNSFYPFYNTGSLPFPHSVITGLGVCVKTDSTLTALTISQVYITENSVKVTVCQGSDLLLTLEAYTYVTGKSCKATPCTTSLEVSGFMTVGSIPASAVGSYKGPWFIDPSCVFYMPSAAYGAMTTLKVNGVEYPINGILSINTTGMLETSETHVMVLENDTTQNYYKYTINCAEAAADYTYTFQTSVGYDMVTTINSQSCITSVTSPVKAFTIRVPHNTIQYAVLESNYAVVVILHATKDFPNCYSTDEDDATETPTVAEETSKYPQSYTPGHLADNTDDETDDTDEDA